MGILFQLTGETVGEVKAVADMHQRKAEMARHSDAFIALPGWYKAYPEILTFALKLSRQMIQRDNASGAFKFLILALKIYHISNAMIFIGTQTSPLPSFPPHA